MSDSTAAAASDAHPKVEAEVTPLASPTSARGVVFGQWSADLTRRTLIKSALAASAAGGVVLLGRYGSGQGGLQLVGTFTPPVKAYTLAGTDGWVSMPVGANAMPPYFPDSLAPANGNSTGNPAAIPRGGWGSEGPRRAVSQPQAMPYTSTRCS